MLNLTKIECPRCLGKGHVDLEDIKRLNMELRWKPGACAYCDGKGKVNKRTTKRIQVDTSYLTIDLDLEERSRLLKGDPMAHERAEFYDAQIEVMIEQIRFLHSTAKMNAATIAAFFRIADEQLKNDQEAFDSFVGYIIRIITEDNGA